jgi:hypothetical protein
MDVKKLNSLNFKAAVYIVPFVLLIVASSYYLAFLIRCPSVIFAVWAVVVHCLFLLSLSAVLVNIITEFFLEYFTDKGKSPVCSVLYGSSRIVPLRPLVFSAIFAAAYILLVQILSFSGILQALILFLPAAAIFLNAPRFITRRPRYISGSYIVFTGSFQTVISYFVNDSDSIIIITEDGQTLDTGINTAETEFGRLEAEFSQNGLTNSNPNKY